MGKRIKEALHGYEIEEVLLSFFLFIMLIICTLQVIYRYVLQSSLSWSEECARYIFVWIVWVAAAYATKRMRHLRITFLKEIAPPDKQWIFDLFSLIMMLLFAVIFGITSVQVTLRVAQTGQLSPAMLLPMWIPYLSVPFGGVFMTIFGVELFLKTLEQHLQVRKGTLQKAGEV